VARENPRSRLCFAGEDRGLTDSDGRARRIADYLLETLPADTMAAGRVERVGRRSPGHLAALRRRAGVTVCSSRYETFGSTAIEAMSQGCPPVAAGTGAVLEIVNDGFKGLLSRSDDAGDLAETIPRLRGDGDLAARLGHRAGLDCDYHYNSTSVAGRMVETYRRLIGRSSRRAVDGSWGVSTVAGGPHRLTVGPRASLGGIGRRSRRPFPQGRPGGWHTGRTWRSRRRPWC
jgi:hypothetical protein